MIVNVKSIAQYVTQNQKLNNDIYQCECKKYRVKKKSYSWNPSSCICEYSKNWKSIVDDSVIACDDIKNVADIVLTIVKNTVPANVANTVAINVTNVISTKCHDHCTNKFWW